MEARFLSGGQKFRFPPGANRSRRIVALTAIRAAPQRRLPAARLSGARDSAPENARNPTPWEPRPPLKLAASFRAGQRLSRVSRPLFPRGQMHGGFLLMAAGAICQRQASRLSARFGKKVRGGRRHGKRAIARARVRAFSTGEGRAAITRK